ncbi:MAG: DNA repair protein RecN [Armatimonadaceae bacterium]
MLTELAVENFALVEKLRLCFGPGLNLLTGETGAGKSILLDALGMALGEKTSGDFVRHGAEKARVEAVFAIPDSADRLRAAVEAAGAEIEDGMLLLSREIGGNGRGSARVNGRPVTLSMLKSIGDALVDIHGQHEHQSLLYADHHAEILDSWCGPEMAALKASVAEAYTRAASARRELEDLQKDARERARTLDLLTFQRDEIDRANLRPDEEEELVSERIRLASAEKLFEASNVAYAALAGGEGGGGRGKMALMESAGAVDALSRAVGEIEQAAKFDEALNPILDMLQSALIAADEASREVRTYRDGIEFNPDRLMEIENRLDVLKTLKRKYGDSLEEVLRYREEIAERLDTLENAESRIAELQETVERAEKELRKQAAALTKARKAAAEPFAQAIQKELADLAMSATRFAVSIESREPNRDGGDDIQFLISPNPGVPLKPLAKIASGGEISRVMLALKSVLSRTLFVPTLIFDEIDTGIGGKTGAVIGEKLHALARHAQVLCITHLPTIAARGDRHFYIEKQTAKNQTRIQVQELADEDRVREIARMLGGNATETELQHAREMLAKR